MKLCRTACIAALAMSAVSYLMLSPLISCSFYYMLLFPGAGYKGDNYMNNTACGIKAKDLDIKTVNNENLHAWYFHKPKSKYLLLMHHGNSGNISILQWYADLALESGASIILYDYEGYGKSSGKPSISAVLRDSKAVYEYANKNLGWQEDQIINLGVSLGTAAASELGRSSHCKAVILFAPFLSLRKTGREFLSYLKYYPDFLWPETDIGSLRFAASSVHPPALVFHGQADKLVRPEDAEQLKIASAGKRLELVRLNCGHSDFQNERPRILSELRRFLNRL